MMMKFNKILLLMLFVVLFSFGAYATTLLTVSDGITNPYNGSVWRGNITFNFTTNAPAMNVTFHFVTSSGASMGTIPVNITVFNDTAADTVWNLTVNSGAGTSAGTMIGTWTTTSGGFNVTLTIENSSYPGIATEPTPELNKTLLGQVQGSGFTYSNLAPEVAPLNFTFNGINTNNQNFTGGTIYVNLTVVEKSASQSNCQAVGGVKWVITTSSGSVMDTQFMLSNSTVTTCQDIVSYSGRKGLSYWNLSTSLTGGSDDQYRMTITANDTTICGGNGPSGGRAYCTPNLNATTFLSFAIDNPPPNVTSFVMNYSNASNLSLSSLGKIEFNVTTNDSTTSVQYVKLGFANGNGTELNLSAGRNSTTWSVELSTSPLTDGTYTVQYYVNDSLNNLNRSRNSPTGPLTFTLDRVAPFVGSFWMNNSNASNLSSSLVSILTFNATVNDTTLGTQEVRFGFYNGNGTGFNLTATHGNAGVWTATAVASALSDGTYTILITANDTVNNLNNTISNLTFTLDRTPPNVTSFVMNFSNSSNFSSTRVGKIEFNITANDSTTTVQSVKLGFNNGNGTELNLSASRNSTAWSVELPVLTLGDGIYTVQYYVNDTLNNLNQSRNSPTGPLTFRLDQTPPNVTSIRFGNYTTGSALGPSLSNRTTNVFINLSAFINDTLGVQNVLFNITNSSGTVLSLSLSGSPVVEYWNASSVVNVSALAEGTYYINVIANDTVANVNRTQNFTFIIDRSAPTATVSCSPSSVTVGDSVACTCSGTDTISSIANSTFSSGSSTQSTATTTTGTGTSLVCTTTDSAGNTATATGSWTVNAAAAATGSSSGGGGAAGVQLQETLKPTESAKGPASTLTNPESSTGSTSSSETSSTGSSSQSSQNSETSLTATTSNNKEKISPFATGHAIFTKFKNLTFDFSTYWLGLIAVTILLVITLYGIKTARRWSQRTTILHQPLPEMIPPDVVETETKISKKINTISKKKPSLEEELDLANQKIIELRESKEEFQRQKSKPMERVNLQEKILSKELEDTDKMIQGYSGNHTIVFEKTKKTIALEKELNKINQILENMPSYQSSKPQNNLVKSAMQSNNHSSSPKRWKLF